jgi:hypothetical protein
VAPVLPALTARANLTLVMGRSYARLQEHHRSGRTTGQLRQL